MKLRVIEEYGEFLVQVGPEWVTVAKEWDLEDAQEAVDKIVNLNPHPPKVVLKVEE